MIFYQLEDHQLVGTQADAKKSGQLWEQVDIPVDKLGLMAYLNERNSPVPEPEFLDDEDPAGMSALNAPEDLTGNPYPSGDRRYPAEHVLSPEKTIAAYRSGAQVPKTKPLTLNIEVQIEETILSTTYAKAELWQSLCINRMVEIIVERKSSDV